MRGNNFKAIHIPPSQGKVLFQEKLLLALDLHNTRNFHPDLKK